MLEGKYIAAIVIDILLRIISYGAAVIQLRQLADKRDIVIIPLAVHHQARVFAAGSSYQLVNGIIFIVAFREHDRVLKKIGLLGGIADPGNISGGVESILNIL